MHAEGQVGDDQVGGEQPGRGQGADGGGDHHRDDAADERRRGDRHAEQRRRVPSADQAAQPLAGRRGPTEHGVDDRQLRQPMGKTDRPRGKDAGAVGSFGSGEQRGSDEHDEQRNPAERIGPVPGHQVTGQTVEADEQLAPSADGEHGDHGEHRADRASDDEKARVDQREGQVAQQRQPGLAKAGEHRSQPQRAGPEATGGIGQGKGGLAGWDSVEVHRTGCRVEPGCAICFGGDGGPGRGVVIAASLQRVGGVGKRASAPGGHVVDTVLLVDEVGVMVAVTAQVQRHPAGVAQGVDHEAVERHLGFAVAMTGRPCRGRPGEDHPDIR